MIRRFSILSILLVVLTLASPVLAQGPDTPQHSDPAWSATYWNNTTLSGTPALTRQDTDINFVWGAGSPSGAVNADNFSARWTRYISVTPGTYTFTAVSDDGIRLWIDNTLVLDKWSDHPATTYTVDRYLDSGHHYLVVEYYEHVVDATAKLSWALKDTTPATGDWKAEYFNNLTLSGSPNMTRNEAAINYSWGSGAPATGINADNFSVRWTRNASIAAGMTRFSLTVDDGARLWVNGHLLIDAWYQQGATTYTGDIYLPGGAVTIELQYYEGTGDAVAKLSWSGSGSGTGPGSEVQPGEVVVDDQDAGFVQGGATAGWRTVSEGYKGRLTWTWNNRTVAANYNWARWYPRLAPGRYEVYVYIPERYTTTANARYWVVHSGQYTLRTVNQSRTGSQWVYLGTYTFVGDGNEYVSLADVTYETYRSRLIAFDAVKWVPR